MPRHVKLQSAQTNSNQLGEIHKHSRVKLQSPKQNDRNCYCFGIFHFMDMLWKIVNDELLKRGRIKTKEEASALDKLTKVLEKFEKDNPNLANFLSNNKDSRKSIFSTSSDLNDVLTGFVQNQFLKFDIVTFVDRLVEVKEEEKSILIQEILKQREGDLSFTEIESNLSKSLKGISDLRLEVYARALTNLPTKQSTQLSFERYKSSITHIGINGTIIGESSPQCIICCKGKGVKITGYDAKYDEKFALFDDLGFEKKVPIKIFTDVILPLAKKNGLPSFVNMDNFWTSGYGLHLGCRHSFTPLMLKN